jgi:PAS domain S-box-containing protein
LAGETIIQTIFVSFGHIHKSIINQLPFKNINMNNNIFSIVFEHSTDCFIYILPDGKISGVNKTFEQITGLDAQDYIQGKIKLKDFVHPDDRQIAEQLFHEENKIPSLIEPTIRLVSISEQISYFRLQMHVVEESSEYAGKMVQLTNITEQINNQELRLKNQSLVNENVRYKDYYENAPDIYLSMHPETTLILDCNQTMVDTLGYSKKELKKKTIFDLYTAESALYAKNVLYPEFIRRGLFNNAFV